MKEAACRHTDHVVARRVPRFVGLFELWRVRHVCHELFARFDGIVDARLLQEGRGDVDAFRLRPIEHAVITEQEGPGGLFRAILSGRLPLVADVPEDDGRRLLSLADSPAQLCCLIESKPESRWELLRSKSKDIESAILFLREQVCGCLTGPRLAPRSHTGFKLLDN